MLPHLERDHDSEQEPDAGKGQEQLNRGRGLEHGLHLVLEPAHLTVQILDLLEKLLSGVGRIRRQEIETLPQEGAAPHAEEIAHLQKVEGVLGQGGVNPILELRALADEQPCACAEGRAGRAARPGESRPWGECRCVGAD